MLHLHCPLIVTFYLSSLVRYSISLQLRLLPLLGPIGWFGLSFPLSVRLSASLLPHSTLSHHSSISRPVRALDRLIAFEGARWTDEAEKVAGRRPAGWADRSDRIGQWQSDHCRCSAMHTDAVLRRTRVAPSGRLSACRDRQRGERLGTLPSEIGSARLPVCPLRAFDRPSPVAQCVSSATLNLSTRLVLTSLLIHCHTRG